MVLTAPNSIIQIHRCHVLRGIRIHLAEVVEAHVWLHLRSVGVPVGGCQYQFIEM